MNNLQSSLLAHSLLPFVFVMFNSLLQLFALRIALVKYYISFLLGFLVGFLLLSFVEIIFFSQNIFNYSYFFLNYFNYFLMSFAYFCLLTTGKTSLRIRLLTEINLNKNGISLKSLYQKYNAKEITNTRISRLLSNKQIYIKNKKYFYKWSITLLIGIFLYCLKFIFFKKKSKKLW